MGPAILIQQLADRLANIQVLTYEHFEVDGIPQDKILVKEMEEWAADQLHKTSWFHLIDKDAILCADEVYNAHFIARIAGIECGYGDIADEVNEYGE